MATKKTGTKKTKRIVAPRTMNAGTMTKSMFMSWVRSALRSRTRFWKPTSVAKMKARRKSQRTGRALYEYQCAECKGWFLDKEVAVDHIVEAGSLTDYEDLPDFVRRLFCEEDGFQVLCNKREDKKVSCHKIKTDEYNKQQREKRKKK